jgi:hypothetical protein
MTSNFPFTADMIAWAQASQAKWQIPSSLILSAAMLESSLGAHVSAGTNNWFGIKDPHGPNATTREQSPDGSWYTVAAGFKVFATPADGFMYYGQLLGLGEPYHDMVTVFLKSDRSPAAVQALSRALTGVYATAQNYGASLIAIQQQYNLYQYDILPRAPAPTPEKPPVTTPPTISAPSTTALAPAAVPPIVAPAPAAPSVKQTALDVGDALETLLKLADAAAQAGVPAALSLLPAQLKFITMFFAPTVIQGYIHTAIVQLEASAQGKTINIDMSNSIVAMVVQALNANEAWLVGQLDNLEAYVQPLVTKYLTGAAPSSS